METLDIIKELCEKKGISISQLENKLEFGNGSLSKSKNMSADRLYQVAKFFDVSMEYMMTGKTIDETDDEMTKLRQQQSILMEINKVSQQMSEYYKKKQLGLSFNFHSLRHFAASFRSDLNVPRKYIEEAGRWKSGSSVLDRVYDNTLTLTRKKYTQLVNKYIEDTFDISTKAQ